MLQGCPASGSLFVLAIDPLIRCLHTKLSSPREICRAFADDIALVLQSLTKLKCLKSVFNFFQAVSGLALKPKKCLLIPVGIPFSLEVKEQVQKYLKDYVPEWASFGVVPYGKYLGVWAGPGAEQHVWDGPAEKWGYRSLVLAKARMSPIQGLIQYNIRAMPTMGYVAQLYPVNKSLLKQEKSYIQKMMHFFRISPNQTRLKYFKSTIMLKSRKKSCERIHFSIFNKPNKFSNYKCTLIKHFLNIWNKNCFVKFSYFLIA